MIFQIHFSAAFPEGLTSGVGKICLDVERMPFSQTIWKV